MFLIDNLKETLNLKPHAFANIEGNGIKAWVKFYQTNIGVIVVAQANGLPRRDAECKGSILGFHIHAGSSCTGDAQNPFKDALAHYNPNNCNHPYHVGDMPPLFENEGYALAAFLTNRFTVRDIIGKTVIIHDQPDDFTSQPSGNAGAMIACGEIKKGNPN